MKRLDFIKTLAISGLSIPLVPYFQNVSNINKIDEKALKRLMGLETDHLVAFEDTFLEEKTLSAFRSLKKAAIKDGIDIKIVSGFRSFQRQKEIVESKLDFWKKKGYSTLEAYQKITVFSSIPGTSRHHWGTDIDLIDNSPTLPEGDLLIQKNYAENGAFYNFSRWMQENAADYGFYLTYPEDENRSGFAFEPWHFSYRDAAIKNLKSVDFEALHKELTSHNIKGFNELPNDFLPKYLKDYMYGINPILMP